MLSTSTIQGALREKPKPDFKAILKVEQEILTILNQLMAIFGKTSLAEEKKGEKSEASSAKKLGKEIQRKLSLITEPLTKYLKHEKETFQAIDKLFSDMNNITLPISLSIKLSKLISQHEKILLENGSTFSPPGINKNLLKLIHFFYERISKDLANFIIKNAKTSSPTSQQISAYLEKGADITENTVQEQIFEGNYAAVDLFLTLSNKRSTGTHYVAAFVNNIEIAKLLLKHGVKPGTDVLFTAIGGFYRNQDSPDLVELYFHELKNELSREHILSLFQLGLDRNKPQSLNAMLKYLEPNFMADFFKSQYFQNWADRTKFNFATLQFLFDHGLDLETPIWGDRTLLEIAAYHHDLESVKFLIHHQANKTRVDKAIELTNQRARSYELRDLTPGIHVSLIWSPYSPAEKNYHEILFELQNYSKPLQEKMTVNRRPGQSH